MADIMVTIRRKTEPLLPTKHGKTFREMTASIACAQTIKALL
jgi:hypothetical protein